MKKILLSLFCASSCFGAVVPPGGGSGGSVSSNTVYQLGFAPTNSFPWVRLMSDGTVYSSVGKVSTSGSKTAGINEAIHALYQTNGLGLIVGGGKIYADAGIYDCTTNITIPNWFNFELQFVGAGKSSTLIIDSTVGTNFIVLENTNPLGAVTNGGTKPFQFAFRDIGFAKRYDTNKTALIFLDNKANQGIFENCAFSSLQCLTFIATNAPNPVGQGGGLLFISGTPTNAVGTIGVWINGGFDNKITFRKCDFYGLAIGICYGADHGVIEDCMFSANGRWYSPGTLTPNDTTAWTAIGTFGNHNSKLTNIFSVGGCIIGNDNTYDLTMERCYFFESHAGFINCNVFGFGPHARLLNPFWETCSYGILNVLDENDESFATTSLVLYDSPVTTVAFSAYLRITNGTISSAIPTTPATISRLEMSPLGFRFANIFNATLLNVDTLTGLITVSSNLTVSGNTTLNNTTSSVLTVSSSATNWNMSGFSNTNPATGNRTMVGPTNTATAGWYLGASDSSGTTAWLNTNGLGGGGGGSQTPITADVNYATFAATNFSKLAATNGGISLGTNASVASGEIIITNKLTITNANGGVVFTPGNVAGSALSFAMNIAIAKANTLVVSNLVQVGSPATADNGAYWLYGTNGHLSRLSGVNVEGVDQAGFSWQLDSTIAAYFGTNHFEFLKTITITNTDGRIITSPTNLFEVFTTNSGSMVFSNDASLKINGSFQVTGSGTNGIDSLYVTNSLRTGTLVIDNQLASTNISHTFVRTNFISGQLYTNLSGGPIEVMAKATLGVAAVSGNSVLSLEMLGNETNQVGMSTLVTSIAMTYTNMLNGVVTNNGTYVFTNKSSGAGNTAAVVGGQIIVY